jgi:disulfide bond formation protein DsbB
MNYSAGYVKDAIAVVGFMVAFILVYGTTNLHTVKPVILASLLLSIIIDGIFTVYPGYHHCILGYNMPTYILGGTIISFIPLVFQFLKLYR